MDPTLLGLVLDSSAVIVAERNKQPIANFIASILTAHGPLDISLSPVTVAELVHGIYRAKSPETSERAGGPTLKNSYPLFAFGRSPSEIKTALQDPDFRKLPHAEDVVRLEKIKSSIKQLDPSIK